MEQGLLAFIRKHYDGWIIEQDKTLIAPKHIDIVIPDKGLAIEFNGSYYHSSTRCDKNYHINKSKGVAEYGFKLIHISDYDWVSNRKIVESRLLSMLGKNTSVFARKTEVREIKFPKNFLNENHIQGEGSPSSSNYGLFLKDELVAVMTFSPPKFPSATTIYDYELVRYCSLLGVNVVGGAGKLLARFRKDYPNVSIMSYSDKGWSTGELYEKLGFIHVGTTEPGYAYYHGPTQRLSRQACTKRKLLAKFPQYEGTDLTEEDIMSKRGYYKMFNCGNDRWLLK
jgi:hypothetical protein